ARELASCRSWEETSTGARSSSKVVGLATSWSWCKRSMTRRPWKGRTSTSCSRPCKTTPLLIEHAGQQCVEDDAASVSSVTYVPCGGWFLVRWRLFLAQAVNDFEKLLRRGLVVEPLLRLVANNSLAVDDEGSRAVIRGIKSLERDAVGRADRACPVRQDRIERFPVLVQNVFEGARILRRKTLE